MTVSTMSDKEWAALTRAVERPDLLEDPRFASPAMRDKNINERLALVQEILLTRTTADWLERLEAENVPCAPALSKRRSDRSCGWRRDPDCLSRIAGAGVHYRWWTLSGFIDGAEAGVNDGFGMTMRSAGSSRKRGCRASRYLRWRDAMM